MGIWVILFSSLYFVQFECLCKGHVLQKTEWIKRSSTNLKGIKHYEKSSEYFN